MDCIGQHPTCKASCCRLVTFQAVGRREWDMKGYWEAHGFTVVEVKDLGEGTSLYSVTVPAACKHLQPDHKCGIYTDPDRYRVCDALTPATATSFMITPGCLLEAPDPTDPDETTMNEDLRKALLWADYASLKALLERYGFAVHAGESEDDLREAVKVNIEDGTIDPDEALSTLGGV